MYNCEKCKIEVLTKYGSGRFCSSKCARSFSTLIKRNIINEKVSKTLTKPKTQIISTCNVCKTSFTFFTTNIHKTRNICSKSCKNLNFKNSTLGKTWKVKDSSKMGGLRNGGGKSKQISYTNRLNEEMKLNTQEIRVAKILDHLKLNWNRNWNGFPYTSLDNKLKNYYPDFYLKDFNVYLEFKGWVSKEIIHKMNHSSINNNLNLIIIYSEDPRYKNLGLNIEQLEKNNLLLLNLLADRQGLEPRL